jgi:YVTN family beta-propeller protein
MLDRAYLVGWEGPSLTVLDSKPSIVGKVGGAGTHLWGLAVDETAGKLYATRAGSSQLAIIDEASGRISYVKTGAIPCSVTNNPTTGRAYVTNHGDDTVTVIEAAKLAPLATVKVGHLPQGIAVDMKSNRVYVANVHSDTVSVIDGATNRVVKTLRTKKNPYALAVDSNTGRVFVAFVDESAATVLDSN